MFKQLESNTVIFTIKFKGKIQKLPSKYLKIMVNECEKVLRKRNANYMKGDK